LARLNLHSLAFLFAISVNASAQQSVFEPTDLEEFVSEPAVVLDEERLVGEIRSVDSIVKIHYIEVADQFEPGVSMRGARIDLQTNSWNDTIYLDENQLAQLAFQLRSQARSIEELGAETNPLHSFKTFGQLGTGTAECWFGNPVRERILCPNIQLTNGFRTFWLNVRGASEQYPLRVDQIIELGNTVQGTLQILDPEEYTQANGSASESSAYQFVEAIDDRPADQ
jgi:hypothetical protein